VATAPEELTVTHDEGPDSVVMRWPADRPRALLHILHGWAEHARRYDRPARALVAAGYTVVADDHRGHGQSGVRSDTLGDLGPRGMDGVLDAAHDVTRAAVAQGPDVPVFVLGHSWGSFLLQRYLRRWSNEIDGALLTGTTYRDPDAASADRPPPNERFEPARTPYDWLSRDETEVDLYVADPLCGFEIMRDTPGRSSRTGTRPPGPTTTPGPRPDLPILVFNGSDDPVGGEVGGRALAEHYRGLGVVDVTFVGYEGARHELFNETNRDEVVGDVIAWLDERAPSPA
jgi:alpha-beta hydrolase superfamily lysophospholipase